MIWAVDGEFVISSGGGVWLPGVYESREAARLALLLPALTLQQLQLRANGRMPDDRGGTITQVEVCRLVNDAKRVRKNRTTTTPRAALSK